MISLSHSLPRRDSGVLAIRHENCRKNKWQTLSYLNQAAVEMTFNLTLISTCLRSTKGLFNSLVSRDLLRYHQTRTSRSNDPSCIILLALHINKGEGEKASAYDNECVI